MNECTQPLVIKEFNYDIDSIQRYTQTVHTASMRSDKESFPPPLFFIFTNWILSYVISASGLPNRWK